jgi:hypothetical protein
MGYGWVLIPTLLIYRLYTSLHLCPKQLLNLDKAGDHDLEVVPDLRLLRRLPLTQRLNSL